MRKMMRKFTLELIKRIPFILGTLIIVSGICGAFDAASDFIMNDPVSLSKWLSPAVRIIGGIMIFLDPNRNVVRSVGFYALTIGVSRFFSSITPFCSPGDVLFFAGCVLMALSINMIVSGFMYLNGTSRGRNKLFLTSLLMLLLQLIESGAGFVAHDAFSFIDSTVLSFMYIALIITLDTDEVRNGMLYEQINEFVRGSRLSTTIDPRLIMSRSDALVFRHMFADRSKWKTVDDGRIEQETVIVIRDFGGSEYIKLQKWKESEKIHCVLSDSPDGTLIQGRRFAVEKITDDGKSDEMFEWIRLFDKDRLIAHISVDTRTHMGDL